MRPAESRNWMLWKYGASESVRFHVESWPKSEALPSNIAIKDSWQVDSLILVSAYLRDGDSQLLVSFGELSFDRFDLWIPPVVGGFGLLGRSDQSESDVEGVGAPPQTLGNLRVPFLPFPGRGES